MIPNLFPCLNQKLILTMLRTSNFYSTMELVIGQGDFWGNRKTLNIWRR